MVGPYQVTNLLRQTVLAANSGDYTTAASQYLMQETSESKERELNLL